MLAFVGCYTTPDRQGRGKGISVYRVDPSSGQWTFLHHVEAEQNPSFLTVDRQQRFLYAVHGGFTSQVSAFAIGPATGALNFLNRQPSHGVNPVYPDLDADAKRLVVANYTGGTISAYSLLDDGRIGEATDVRQHEGPLGPNPDRQDGPHPHQITWDRAGRYLFVPDLGQDRTYVYRLSPTGKFEPGEPPFVESPPGSGPRHIAFHPNGRTAYLLHEMGNILTTLSYDAERGAPGQVQTVSTLPQTFDGVSTASEVIVGPSGRFVYASNRGHDSIAVFAVDPTEGTLTAAERISTQGEIPRHFAIDPVGAFLYAENQKSDSIVAFRIDASTGQLQPTGQVIETGSPVCIAFADL